MFILINSVQSITNNQFNININYESNNTIILFYNLTTKYSYFITFRSFNNKQLKYGLLSPLNKSKELSIKIFYPYETNELFDLFIICFHFVISLTKLDIQCRDINLLKKNEYIKLNNSKDFLPSYNPLFVPMMYALSVLMLLPVIIQHHRHKQIQSIRRRKELRRLSVSIVQDKQNSKQDFARKILSQISQDGDINYEKIPMNVELLSVPSSKTILDDIDDNPNVTFTIENFLPFTHIYDDIDINEETGIDAHDCIAHLLDNTPWNTSDIEQPLSTSLFRHPVIHDCPTAIKEQDVPTIISFRDNDNGGSGDDDRKPILKSNKYQRTNVHRKNRKFFESDV